MLNDSRNGSFLNAGKISRLILLSLLFTLQATLSAKLYDCFTFFNELELLKVRLEELYDSVDHFVLVEATQTFCGDPKPLYYEQNAESFARFRDKIIHVIVDDIPAPTTDPVNDRWVREEFQRNAMLRGLVNCQSNDIILISDLDEIPNRRSIHEIRNFFYARGYHTKKTHRKVASSALIKSENQLVCELHMRMFLFHLNCESLFEWNGAVKAAPYWLVNKRSPWNLRLLHMYDRDLFKIYNAGCHFHSMGGYERLRKKLFSIYRCEASADPNANSNDPDVFVKWTKSTYGCMTVPFDDAYPRYLLENLDYFRSIGWIAE